MRVHFLNIQFPSLTTINNEYLRLVCEARGEPPPDVFWTRENKDKIIITDKNTGRRSQGQFMQGFYYRIESIFILPIVSDCTNVFIVTWRSYAEEELTYSLALATDWLTKCQQTSFEALFKLTYRLRTNLLTKLYLWLVEPILVALPLFHASWCCLYQ